MIKILLLKQLHSLTILGTWKTEGRISLSRHMINAICSHLTELRELKFEIFTLKLPLDPNWPKKLESLKIITHEEVDTTITLPSNLKKFKIIDRHDPEEWNSLSNIADPTPLFTIHLKKIRISGLIQESEFLKIAECPNIEVNFQNFFI